MTPPSSARTKCRRAAPAVTDGGDRRRTPTKELLSYSRPRSKLLFDSFAAWLGREDRLRASMSQQHLTHQPTSRPRALPGTGRIGIVRAYFDISAVLMGVGIAGVVSFTVIPAVVGRATVSGRTLFATAAAAVFAWGSVQTSRLLRDRQRSGAWAAGVTFVASLVPVGVQSLSVATVGMSLVGLGLIASVWRHLE